MKTPYVQSSRLPPSNETKQMCYVCSRDRRAAWGDRGCSRERGKELPGRENFVSSSRTEMADNVADGLAGLSIDPEAKVRLEMGEMTALADGQ